MTGPRRERLMPARCGVRGGESGRPRGLSSPGTPPRSSPDLRSRSKGGPAPRRSAIKAARRRPVSRPPRGGRGLSRAIGGVQAPARTTITPSREPSVKGRWTATLGSPVRRAAATHSPDTSRNRSGRNPSPPRRRSRTHIGGTRGATRRESTSLRAEVEESPGGDSHRTPHGTGCCSAASAGPRRRHRRPAGGSYRPDTHTPVGSLEQHLLDEAPQRPSELSNLRRGCYLSVKLTRPRGLLSRQVHAEDRDRESM